MHHKYKFFILFLCLFILCGCINNKTFDFKINTYKVNEYLKQNNSDIELLRVDNQYVYINELDTYNNPFLFTTKSLIMMNHEGELVKQIVSKRDERIIDFIEYNGNIFYMYLLENDNKYQIDLCKMNNDKEIILHSYNIDDPYAYPKFHKNNNKIYYKINNVIYDLDTLEIILNQDKDCFFAKQNNTYNLYYKMNVGESLYTVYYYNDQKLVNTGLTCSMGNFIVNNNIIYYTSLEDHYLYQYDMNSLNHKVLVEYDIFDFYMINDHILCITTNNNQILFYDLNTNDILSTIDIDKNEEMNNMYMWIYSDLNKDVYFQNPKEIIKISF